MVAKRRSSSDETRARAHTPGSDPKPGTACTSSRLLFPSCGASFMPCLRPSRSFRFALTPWPALRIGSDSTHTSRPPPKFFSEARTPKGPNLPVRTRVQRCSGEPAMPYQQVPGPSVAPRVQTIALRRRLAAARRAHWPISPGQRATARGSVARLSCNDVGGGIGPVRWGGSAGMTTGMAAKGRRNDGVTTMRMERGGAGRRWGPRLTCVQSIATSSRLLKLPSRDRRRAGRRSRSCSGAWGFGRFGRCARLA
jgi:hypothetical protein